MSRMLEALQTLQRRGYIGPGDGQSPSTIVMPVERPELALVEPSPSVDDEIQLSKIANLVNQLTAYAEDEVESRTATLTNWMQLSTSRTPKPLEDSSHCKETSSSVCCQLPAIDPTQPYLELATNIAKDLKEIEPPRTLLLTALGRRVLEQFALLELAIALSHHGNVLVVDAGDTLVGLDLPDPNNRQGFSELLAGRATWREVILPTNLPRVSLVTAGLAQSLDGGHEGCSNQIFDALSPLFSFVLVGGGEVNNATTRWVAATCRATYFVVELGHDGTGELGLAVGRLNAAGATVRGAIAVCR